MSTDPVLLISKNREFNNYLKTHKISSLDHNATSSVFDAGGAEVVTVTDLPGPVYPDLAVVIYQVPSTPTSLF